MIPTVLRLPLGAALVVAAFSPVPSSVDATRVSITAEIVSADFRGIVGGNLYGLGVPDVMFLAGNEPVLFTAPTLHSTILYPDGVTDLVVHDLALVPGGGRHGRDAVAMVTDAGLRLWMSDRVNPYFGVQSLGGALWEGATMVRCGDVDGDEVPDIVGLMANGTKLRVFARGESASNYAIDLGEPVQSFALLQWNGSGASEIAVLTQQQLLVKSGDGATTLFQLAVTSTDGLLTRVARSTGYDLLAWATSASGTPQLHVLGQGLTFPVANLAAMPGALASGDVDHDGEGDLVVTHAAAASPELIAVKAASLQKLDDVTFDDVAVNGNRATALVTDLDNDGDDDVVMPLPGSQRVALWANDAVPAAPIELQSARWLQTNVDQFTFDIASDPPSGATHVEVRTWLLENGLDGLALGEQDSVTFQALSSTTPLAFQVTVPILTAEQPRSIATAVRFVQRDASNAIVAAHPFTSFVHLGFPFGSSPPTVMSNVILPTSPGPLLPLNEDTLTDGGNPVGGSGGDGTLPPPPRALPPQPPSGGDDGDGG